MDQNTKLSSDDKEATEKLVDANSTVGSKGESLSVAQPHNGDSVINIAEVSHAFIGMGKEELIKYANDPFWIKLRWFMFVFFWLMWLGMLGGAIAIIFFAPKCSPPEKPSWKDQPINAVDLTAYVGITSNGSALENFEYDIDRLTKMGVSALLFESIMKSSGEGSDHVIDFMDIDPKLGTLDQLKALLKTLNDKGIITFLKIIPNFSSISHSWFTNSVAKNESFKDYYVWSSGKVDPSTGERQPPNNWLSVFNNSAWTYSDARKEFYLHQFKESQPDLNFRNEELTNYFSAVYQHWLNIGFNGIHLDKVEYLFESQDLNDETIDRSTDRHQNTIHTDYQFLLHTKTKNLDESVLCILKWAEVIRNASGYISTSFINDAGNRNISDFVFRPLKIEKYETVSARSLLDYINRHIKEKNQIWLWEADNVSQETAFALDTLFVMLRGSSLINNWNEILFPANSTVPCDPGSISDFCSEKINDEKVKMNYVKLFSLKKRLSQNGTYPSIINKTITLSRFQQGTSGYTFVYNPDNSTSNFALSFPRDFGTKDDINIIFASSLVRESNEPLFSTGAKENLKEISLPPHTYMLIEFK